MGCWAKACSGRAYLEMADALAKSGCEAACCLPPPFQAEDSFFPSGMLFYSRLSQQRPRGAPLRMQPGVASMAASTTNADNAATTTVWALVDRFDVSRYGERGDGDHPR